MLQQDKSLGLRDEIAIRLLKSIFYNNLDIAGVAMKVGQSEVQAKEYLDEFKEKLGAETDYIAVTRSKALRIFGDEKSDLTDDRATILRDSFFAGEYETLQALFNIDDSITDAKKIIFDNIKTNFHTEKDRLFSDVTRILDEQKSAIKEAYNGSSRIVNLASLFISLHKKEALDSIDLLSNCSFNQ